MPDLAEHPVPEATLANIKGCAAQAIEILDLSDAQAADPAAVVAAVDQFVYDWQRNKRPDEGLFDAEDAPFIFGSLWGQALCARFGWAWVAITFHDHADAVAPGVASPDRALIVYPIHFLIGCFDDPTVDPTLLLAYNMLDAGHVTGVEPHGYLNLMDGVQRIIPRD